MKTDAKLTKNQGLVFDQLQKGDCPQSAYALLDNLRPEGLKAPLQVYRALDALMAKGLVHRLESLNAFVACSHPACEGHKTVAFTICDDCGHVDEVSNTLMVKQLMKIADETGFNPAKVSVELQGLCQDCKPA